MAPPKERKRRFHRRSKNGCQTCKRRHVRCDEQKPLCTNCLQTGSECVYPFPEQSLPSNLSKTTNDAESYALRVASNACTKPQQQPPRQQLAVATTPISLDLSYCLNDYVGGSFGDLPEASKRLLRHFSRFSVWGEQLVARELDSCAVQRAFENPGYMHMCLMLSACQWAWVTGSMDSVRIPFMWHKAATYQFAREQLSRPETAQSGTTMLAISALALTEGAVGELHASSHHLRAVRSTIQWGPSLHQGPSLSQRMLKMIGDGLRTGRSAKLVNVPDYQPTFMALLFASIWDISALPPRAAPTYGWWEESDTQAARLWQNHTKGLNLDYEISRGFTPNQYIPRILNGDPRSSRTSFIATFFYLCGEIGHHHLDVMLIDWLLEQLIDDVNSGEEYLQSSRWSQPLWLWCVMFGASIASSGKADNAMEMRQLLKWVEVFDDKMRLVSRVLGIDSWHSARTVLSEVVGSIDPDVDRGLEDLWDKAVMRGIGFAERTINPAVFEFATDVF